MRVLFQSRKTLFTGPGGDTIQILKTKEWLEKFGVEIHISTELTPDLTGYDLVHVFNLMRPQESHLQVKNAKKQNKNVALSPIYGLYTEYERKARGGIVQKFSNILSRYQIEYLKVLTRGVKNKEIHKGTLGVVLKGYYKTLKEIVDMVDIFLPNSQSEMNRIKQDFDLTDPLYATIPNAVDEQLFDYDGTYINDDVKQYKNCILCVARIEGRKSQLNLVKALTGSPYQIVLIGKPAPNHVKYYDQIRKEASTKVVFLDYIPHRELPQYYKVAKVHALISWMETPGLSSLEAAVMKCNVVITKKGDTEAYFEDSAYYCEPNDIGSIRSAIENAYRTPINENLRNKILDKFTWKTTATETLKAYETVLDIRN